MGAPAPLVTVIVPVYNVEAYVGPCLRSLLSQGAEGLEVIVVNDGSTDGSRAVVGELAAGDARVVVIDKPNSGYGASLNLGLRVARGTYVGILESDDEMVAGALELLVQTAERTGADVVKGDYLYWWSTDEARTHRAGEVSADLAACGLVDTRVDMRVYAMRPTIWSALYRRSHLEEERIRFLETPGASYQDTSFNFKVWALAGRATYLAERVLRYRQDNEASSINSAGKLYCVCDEYAEIRRFLDGRDDLAELLDGVVSRMKFDAYMWNAKRLAPELRAQFLSRAREELLLDRAAGRIDESLLGIYKRFDLEGLLDRPERFARAFGSYGGGGVARSLRHYLALGGPALLARMLLAWCGR